MIFLTDVPTYEYECPRCPRVFEVRQRISEPALSTCDRCGGPVRRLLAATPFILKGGGWYVTDYPSESRKKALSSESGEKSSSPESKSGESKSSESKPGTSDGASSSSAPSSDTSSTTKASPAKASPTKAPPAKSSDAS